MQSMHLDPQSDIDEGEQKRVAVKLVMIFEVDVIILSHKLPLGNWKRMNAIYYIILSCNIWR